VTRGVGLMGASNFFQNIWQLSQITTKNEKQMP